MKVGIVGGGPAGLGLAALLGEAGHHVTLFEAAPELGGLARCFHLGDAKVERYYHFICGSDDGYFRFARRFGFANKIRWTNTSLGFFHDGVLHPFTSGGDLLRCTALPLTGRLRYGAAAEFPAQASVAQRSEARTGFSRPEVILRNRYDSTCHPNRG